MLVAADGTYRGWLAITPVFLATGLFVGASSYAFGLFIEPLERDFGWSRTQISGSLSLVAVGSLAAPAIGRIMDHHGARPVMVASLVLMATSFLLRPLMSELWHWYALSFLQFIGMSGAGQLPAGRLVGVWFPRSRGRAMGIAMMGNNFGGLTIPPLMAWVLTMASWQSAYVTVGAMSLGIIGLTLLMVREYPPNAQSGRDAQVPDLASPRGEGVIALTGWTVRQALHSRAFYAIGAALLLGSFTYGTVLPHLFAHLKNEGLSVASATIALSVLAASGMLGKLAFGYLAERITARYAMMLSFAGQALWLMVLLNPTPAFIVWIFVPLYGLCMGAFGALSSLIVQESFGVRYFGSISGLISTATVISYATGPLLAGASFDLTDSYHAAFIAVAAMLAVGILILTQARYERGPATALQ